jgi:hypothetical protein
LSSALKKFIQGKASSDVVLSTETIARFIYQNSDISKSTSQIRNRALMPRLEGMQLETSVCRTSNISTERIWKIGAQIRTDKAVIARADMLHQHALDEGMKALSIPDLEYDYPEHAVIVGWPDDKDAQMAKATALAYKAKLIML